MKTKRLCDHIHIMTSQMQIKFDKFQHLTKPICSDPWKSFCQTWVSMLMFFLHHKLNGQFKL
jgi:hypothetical protein